MDQRASEEGEKLLTTAENVTILGFISGASKRINAPLFPICGKIKRNSDTRT